MHHGFLTMVESNKLVKILSQVGIKQHAHKTNCQREKASELENILNIRETLGILRFAQERQCSGNIFTGMGFAGCGDHHACNPTVLKAEAGGSLSF